MNAIAHLAPVLLNSVAMAALLFMIAVGLTVIFGLLDVLNMAHGAFFLVGAYIGYSVAGEATADFLSFGLALVVAIVVGVVLGLVLMIMTAPLLKRGHMDQALMTLGLSIVVTELLKLAFGNDDRAVAAPGEVAWSIVLPDGSGYPVYRLILIVVGIAVAIAVWYVVERTSAGAVLRATVADSQMVRAVGIDVRTVTAVTFVIACVLAVVGGVLGGPVFGAAPILGDQVLLLALVVIVVGGLGSVLGTLLAAVLIGLVQNVGVTIAPELAAFATMGAMAIVLAVRPQGLIPASVAVSR